MKKLVLLFACKLLFTVAWSQTTLSDTIYLKNTTVERTIPMVIEKGTAIIKCSVKGYLSAGELSFRIIDPEGKREGGFSLDTFWDGRQRPGSGVMTHEVKVPFPGTWRLEFKANNATGDFRYHLYFK